MLVAGCTRLSGTRQSPVIPHNDDLGLTVSGIGIGANYPLSAVVTVEFAPRESRASMMSWVFFAQPVGQLLANVLSLAAVEGYKTAYHEHQGVMSS